MNHATLLFPGGSIQNHVVDYALDWARENEGAIKAIFILPATKKDAVYSSPKDEDQAEELRKSFEQHDGSDTILDKEIRYIEKRAKARHIPVDFQVMVSPEAENVVDILNQSDILFIDKDLDDTTSADIHAELSLEELKEKITRIFPVGAYDRYSDVFY